MEAMHHYIQNFVAGATKFRMQLTIGLWKAASQTLVVFFWPMHWRVWQAAAA
jgi:hypothetical protein